MDEDRLARVERELSDLKTVIEGNKPVPKIIKKPRAPSEYNKFMKEYISKQKTILGAKYDHKVVFAECGAAWSKKQNP